MSLSDIFKNTAPREIKSYTELKDNDQLWPHVGFMVSDTNDIGVYENNDNQLQSIHMVGVGAFAGRFQGYNNLYDFSQDKLVEGKEYAVSFRMYNGVVNYGQDALNSSLFIQGKSESKVDWIGLTNPSNSMVINGMWSLVELTFVPKGSSYQYALTLKGDDRMVKPFYVDELMVRDKITSVYKVLGTRVGLVTRLLKNNHSIDIER